MQQRLVEAANGRLLSPGRAGRRRRHLDRPLRVDRWTRHRPQSQPSREALQFSYRCSGFAPRHSASHPARSHRPTVDTGLDRSPRVRTVPIVHAAPAPTAAWISHPDDAFGNRQRRAQAAKQAVGPCASVTGSNMNRQTRGKDIPSLRRADAHDEAVNRRQTHATSRSVCRSDREFP